jgi:hypothetical protein
MRIASFNINNIRKRLPNLLDWLCEMEPDVVCLQELKTADAEFPADVIRQAGYQAVWRGQKSWNGIAILARWAPVLTCNELPGDPADTQSRYIEAAVNGVNIASICGPNGNPQPGAKFNYKLTWLKRLEAHAAELYAAGVPVDALTISERLRWTTLARRHSLWARRGCYFWNDCEEVDASLAHILTHMPARRDPLNRAARSAVFIRFPVRAGILHACVSEPNYEAWAGNVVHRGLFVGQHVHAKDNHRLVLKFHLAHAGR